MKSTAREGETGQTAHNDDVSVTRFFYYSIIPPATGRTNLPAPCRAPEHGLTPSPRAAGRGSREKQGRPTPGHTHRRFSQHPKSSHTHARLLVTSHANALQVRRVHVVGAVGGFSTRRKGCSLVRALYQTLPCSRRRRTRLSLRALNALLTPPSCCRA